jgi:hypothetical protein
MLLEIDRAFFSTGYRYPLIPTEPTSTQELLPDAVDSY